MRCLLMSASLSLALTSLACVVDKSDDVGGETSGDGDGDPSGDGDGDPTGDGDPSGDGDGDGDPGTCAAVSMCPSEPASDPFTVTALALVDDCLEVTLSFSGGCEVHEFTGCWDESFAESDPVQAWLWLVHDANGDACEAALTETRRFDLTALRDQWQAFYGPGPGTMIVHVGGQSIEVPI